MKRIYFIGAICSAMLAILSSCEKPYCETCHAGEPSTLTLTLASDGTRSNISTSQAEDNNITSVDVFVFRNTAPTSADYQKLDTYKRFTGNELENITLTSTTGPKTICVVVNEHTNAFKGVTSLPQFRTLVTDLKNEVIGSFTMYGETEETLSTTTSVSLTVKRHICRVAVTSVKTNFSGTPYSEMMLSNIKLYLINAHAQKLIYNNGAPSTPLIYNKGKLIGEDANATIEANMIYEPLTGTVGESGITTPHFFYCYSNETQNLHECTKLVLQADLDGVTYYYPILINQTGYGNTSETGHFGVRRNTTYSYGITVTRPGSLDPNEPIVPGTVELTISAEDWAVIPTFSKEF
jgi:hypothetical protein